MAVSQEAYKALESVVGPEFISQDPAICTTYGPKGGVGVVPPGVKHYAAVDCVVLPQSTKEVQEVVKICNRYKIPSCCTSTYWGNMSTPKFPNMLFIDLKRMQGFEIDERNMYAVCEPGLIYGQVQEEALKRGLYLPVPGGGAQVSVVANTISWGLTPLNYRTSWATRRILGVEWVLPDGELLKLGSLATQKDPFWGQGIGPDLRGIIRGIAGWGGSLGICTKTAVKLFRFQEEKLRPVGITPTSALELPTKRIRWYNYHMPSREAMFQAMYELGKAYIGAAAQRVPNQWRVIARFPSRSQFWEYWKGPETPDMVAKTHTLRILLIGYTSEEQLEHEERVLSDIMAELGGEQHRARPTDRSWFKNADAASMFRATGAMNPVCLILDSIEDSRRTCDYFLKVQRDYMPPITEDYNDAGWFYLNDFGHAGYLEFLPYADPDAPEAYKAEQLALVGVENEDLKHGFYECYACGAKPLSATGKLGPNAMKWFRKVLNTFNPDGLVGKGQVDQYDLLMERAPHLKEVRGWEYKPLPYLKELKEQE